MSKVLSFVSDLITDGYRFVGILAPLLSIGFTLVKAFGSTDFDLQDISYAWALAPLVGWLGIAYARRWSHSCAEVLRIQEEVAALRVSMDNRAALNTARHRLSLLRTEGVGIRNDGVNITVDNLADWCIAAENWNERVKMALAEIDLAMSEWFRTLDAVPLPRIRLRSYVNFRHQKLYGEHDFRLHRLDKLINDNRLGSHT